MPGIAALQRAAATTVVELSPSGVFDLRADTVHQWFGGRMTRMFAFNGSIPGPTLKATQGTEVVIHYTNNLDTDTSVHWHGLRMSSLFDGLPRSCRHGAHLQVPPNGSFSYRLRFPDPGIYWYHDHARGDCSPARGLYGAIVVVPREPGYWPPANGEMVLTLDELPIRCAASEDADLWGPDSYIPTGRDRLMLLNGSCSHTFQAHRGEVVRLYLINVANNRVFRFGIPGAQIKRIGEDIGRVERETMVDEVSISPTQRAIIDTLFENAGRYPIEHRAPDRVLTLGWVEVAREQAEPHLAQAFHALRQSEELVLERHKLLADWERQPDRTLLLTQDTTRLGLPTAQHPGLVREGDTGLPEREDAAANGGNSLWQVIDADTGAVNQQIDWTFGLEQRVKIRLVHGPAADAATQHPVHFHGQRFLVLAHNGAQNDNLAWQDSLLLRAGETMDILLEAANPGDWLVHLYPPVHDEHGALFVIHVRHHSEQEQ
jgi:FtsP/CotA-like multicopper oxidase with cupredoxin domain